MCSSWPLTPSIVYKTTGTNLARCNYSPPGGSIPVPPSNVESILHCRFKQPPPSYDGNSAHYDRPRFGDREKILSHRGEHLHSVIILDG